MKRRVNLTLDGELVAAGKRVAKALNRSHSGLIEFQLRRIVQSESLSATRLADDLKDDLHWLERFHAKYLVQGIPPPSDCAIAALRKGKLKHKNA